MATIIDNDLILEPQPEPVKRRVKDRAMNYIDQDAVIEKLKKGIWIYFILLIIEGGLRKWVLPALATPLLVVRDPVAIWLLWTAWRSNLFPSNLYLSAMGFIGVFATFTALTTGHHNLLVAVYGARIFLFHFPLIFIIGKFFDREDVIKMGKIVLYIAIPMFLLIFVQFNSPQTAFVNKGIGADSEGGGFSGALGYFRPPGTFSFTTGNTQFFSLVGVFVMYFWMNTGKINRILLIAATASFLAAIPVSISRGLLIQTVLTATFVVASVSRTPGMLGRVIATAIAIIITLALLSNVQFFGTAIEVLTSRFDAASEVEGTIDKTIINRIGASIMEPFDSGELPFFGYGIGIGTNAGARILAGRGDVFLVAEGEWGRLIGEMGAIFGIAAIIVRIRLSIQLGIEGFKRLRASDLLPWILVSVSFQAVAQGQWAQPTALGFGVLMGGLTIAAMRQREEKPVPQEQDAPDVT